MFRSEGYWDNRSVKYNKLKWVNSGSYLDNICEAANFDSRDIVLDVGAGTGAVSNHVKKHVKQVVALDISEGMLKKGEWEGISTIHWDIRDILFYKEVFDVIVARMVFHHILEDQEYALDNCYHYLSNHGTFIVAEAVPPSNSEVVSKWFYDMFRYKEERVDIIPSEFKGKLEDADFRNVKIKEYWMNNFSINNWIDNSGLDSEKIEEIKRMHILAPEEVKEAHGMIIKDKEITINSKYVIITAQK